MDRELEFGIELRGPSMLPTRGPISSELSRSTDRGD
jgi:hypothetical protein